MFFLMCWLICSVFDLFTNVWHIFLFLIRRKWRQKSRRQRRMEIQKRQKWRLKSLPCYTFAALSYRPGQHRVVELVLSVPFFFCLRNIPFCLLPCYHIALESWKIVALHPFFMKCYLLVFKMSFFLLVQIGPRHEISFFISWGFILVC